MPLRLSQRARDACARLPRSLHGVALRETGHPKTWKEECLWALSAVAMARAISAHSGIAVNFGGNRNRAQLSAVARPCQLTTVGAVGTVNLTAVPNGTRGDIHNRPP